ncbi:MAG: FHA domain-containing protein [Gloeobacterales cyanobacterium]
MSITCPECGSVNPPESQYCGECGIELSKTEETPALVAEKSAPSPERPPNPRPPKAAKGATPAAEKPLPPKAEPEPIAEPVAPQPPPEEKAPESPPPRPSVLASAPPPASPPHPAPAPIAGTRLQLTQAFLVHTGTGERFELPIGRSLVYIGKPNQELPPDIDVSHLPNTDVVSRVHATICVEGEQYALEDAGSSNGTYLNGELIRAGARFRRPLTSGDLLSLGKGDKVSFRFELEE